MIDGFRNKKINEQKWNAPSEKYLLIHRLFTFLDEWLWYGVLLVLFFTGNYIMTGVVFIFGAVFNIVSYNNQWEMENKRFNRFEERRWTGK